MIRSDKIISAFNGGVGWRQPTLTDMPVIDADNLASSSGLRFEDGNFLVTIKNIYDCREDKDIEDSEFNAFLTNMQNAAILDTIEKVADKQSHFIQANNLYPYEKSFKTTLAPSGRAVGFEIEPCLKNGYILEIPWVELSFDLEKTFKVYLFNSNIPKSAIAEKEVTTTAGESKITDLNWHISDDTTYKGGKFYLVYFEDDLDGAKAYKRDYELSSYQLSTYYYYINPVSITHTSEELDVTTVTNESDTGGVNFGINVYNDYTEVFIRNKSLFWTAIKHQMTEKVLNLIITSSRINNTEMMGQARWNLYGNEKYSVEGVSTKISRAIDDIRKMLFYQPRISRGTLR